MQAALGSSRSAMVARLGSAAVAGVGTASQVQVIVITAFFAVSMGTTVLIAHASARAGSTPKATPSSLTDDRRPDPALVLTY
ncbi:MAG: hypothetical protein R2849_14435 [Thermomicrobiales bacterium]